MLRNAIEEARMLLKDAVLDGLASTCNIAQFVSFSPEETLRYAHLAGRSPNLGFANVEDACRALLASSESRAVNVRSFRPDDSKGQKLIQDLRTVDEITASIRSRASDGYYTIANELVPLEDGGVSGVAIGDVVEFAPADTPKCVEKPGVTTLPSSLGEKLLELVYGFTPDIRLGRGKRVEFSIHPIRRGIRNQHTIIWELEAAPELDGRIGRWPNRYSEFIGDKTYGLLIAHLLGFPVPRTTVVNRNVAPFSFGMSTGTHEIWIRTAPHVAIAGEYPTYFGWTDPYRLMEQYDPGAHVLPTILSQESVDFVFSGAAQSGIYEPVVEGRSGRGDRFMLGEEDAAALPEDVHHAVVNVHDRLVARLGSVKFEWVWDGAVVWIVQLHARDRVGTVDVIFEGDAERYVEFDARRGLKELRSIIASMRGSRDGIVLVGDVGVTSHLGDVLREARIPSRLQRNR